MMIAVVVIFAICWLPQHTYFVIQNLQPTIICYRHIQHVYLVIYWFAMSNSMYNPIMYCWMNARQVSLHVVWSPLILYCLHQSCADAA